LVRAAVADVGTAARASAKSMKQLTAPVILHMEAIVARRNYAPLTAGRPFRRTASLI
jgi:hypothetical protein